MLVTHNIILLTLLLDMITSTEKKNRKLFLRELILFKKAVLPENE